MPQQQPTRDGAGRAMRFLAIKAGIFIGIPVMAAVMAAVTMFK